MTVKKGLKSLVEGTPDFSNQNIENAVNKLKIGWVAKTFTLDTAITTNNVLTDTQKNNARLSINNHPHLNIGRYMNDMLVHTDTILDGSIVPVPANETQTATFLEILQGVQGLQSLIPELLGVTAGESSRDVNDHLGTINNKFLETEDSSEPVFISLAESISFIPGNEAVDVQVALEKSNCSTLSTYTNTLIDNSAFVSLADDPQLRKLMTRVSQNTNWISYFTDYEKNQDSLNPIYTTDSDKDSIIDAVLRNQGLPDVLSSVDIEAIVAEQLDLNQDADTLS